MRYLHRHRGLVPYLLLAPGLAWLAVFFVVPLGFLVYQSLQSGSFEFGYSFDWAWATTGTRSTDYHEQLIRSLVYAGLATVIALVVSYPLVYWIAFRGGRWKNLFLLVIIAPFFVTYLIRTLAWQTILSDRASSSTSCARSGSSRRAAGCSRRRSPSSPGITYNFLPFMALPLYVALEQIDARLIEAAQDLYASRLQAFLRVTLPLSLPGVLAGTLLTFIPAAGDFINAQLLGTPRAADDRQRDPAQVPGADRLPGGGRALVRADGGDPRRRAVYARSLGDGEADRMSAPRVRAPRADRLRAARVRLPAAADRGRDRVLVQRPRRPLQLHLAGLHARQLAELERRARALGRDGRSRSQIAALASVVATVLGTLIALALVRHGFRGRGATNLLIFLPMSTPEIVLGASLLALFLNMRFATGFTTIVDRAHDVHRSATSSSR